MSEAFGIGLTLLLLRQYDVDELLLTILVWGIQGITPEPYKEEYKADNQSDTGRDQEPKESREEVIHPYVRVLSFL